MNDSEKLKVAREALEDIVNPILKMQRELPEGCRLDGGMALHIAGDIQHSRRIAESAIAVIDAPSAEQPAWASVDSEKFWDIVSRYKDLPSSSDAIEGLLTHVDAWGAQQALNAVEEYKRRVKKND